MTLEDKKILVTGASSGIGSSIVKGLLQSGAYVIATARDVHRLSAMLTEDENNRLTIKPLDYGNISMIENFHNEVGKIDGFVNSVGISEMVPAKLADYNHLSRTMNINFIAPSLLINSLLRKRKFNKGASIVLISSIAGTTITNIGMSAYAASKSAIDGYMRTLALEIAPKLRINAVAPGMIDTKGGMYADTIQRMSPEGIDKDIHMYPMGRFGQPEDINGLITFLLSNESSWMTGQTFVVDGGRTLK